MLAILLPACGARDMDNRLQTAAILAKTGGLAHSTVQAGGFTLAVWARVSQAGTPVNIYIEGDGRAWLSYHLPSPDPTPDNPVALRLAAADASPNVIYIARPCQYTMACTDEGWWTDRRFAPAVILAYDAAITALTRQWGLDGVHMTGYSGGAAVAVLTAAQRNDVLSLRTVAGNINNAMFLRLHRLSAMPESLEPLDAAPALARIPQRHFAGGKDRIVPSSIAQSWRETSPCVQVTIMREASHDKGWAESWPKLLKDMPECEQ